MHFSCVAATAIAAMLSAPSLACQCFSGDRVDVGKTHGCCNGLGGVFVNGDNCQAGSISERLSNFRRCCDGQSDCDYPHKRPIDDLELEEEA